MPTMTIEEAILNLILVDTNHPEIHREGHVAIKDAVTYLERLKKLQDRLQEGTIRHPLVVADLVHFMTEGKAMVYLEGSIK